MHCAAASHVSKDPDCEDLVSTRLLQTCPEQIRSDLLQS